MGAEIIVDDIQVVPEHPFVMVDKIIQTPQEITTQELRVTNRSLWEKYFGTQDE